VYLKIESVAQIRTGLQIRATRNALIFRTQYTSHSLAESAQPSDLCTLYTLCALCTIVYV
jgi:hypothetical protein